LKNYRLLQERQPEIGGALSCQRMLALFFFGGRLLSLNRSLQGIGPIAALP